MQLTFSLLGEINTAEPDQMAPDKVSDQDLHCFSLWLKMTWFQLNTAG